MTFPAEFLHRSSTQRSFYTAVATQRSFYTAVATSGVSTPQFNTAEFPHRSSVQFLKEVEWLAISEQRDFTTSNTAFQLSTRGGNVESRRATTVDSCDSFVRDRKADLGTSKRQPEDIKLSLAARQASQEAARDELSSNQHILTSL